MARRVVLVFTSMLALVLLSAAAPAGATQDVAWPCRAVLDGTLGQRAVQKAVTVSDGPGADATLVVSLTTTAQVRETLVVECSWIDLDGDSARDTNENVTFDLKPVMFTGTSTREGTFRLTRPQSTGARICDKVVVLGLQPPRDLVQLRSNTACGQTHGPVVPEIDAVPLLGVSAILAGGAVLVVRRRRSLAH